MNPSLTIKSDLKFLPDSRSETLDFFPSTSDAPAPLVIFVHGGGWIKGDKTNKREQSIGGIFQAAGYAFISTNYLLAAESQNTYLGNCAESYPTNVQDVQAAIQYAITNAAVLNIDPNRVALMGASAGAHLALLAVTTWTDGQCPIKALGLMYGVFDWRTFNGSDPSISKPVYGGPQATKPEHQALAEVMSPIIGMTADIPPIYAVTGTADEEVHHSQSEQLEHLCTSLGRQQDQFVYVPGAQHSFHFTLPNYDVAADVLPFLTQHL